MKSNLDLAPYSEQPVSTQVLLSLFKEYRRPYDKISELVNQGFLIQLRKGLYLISNLVSSKSPESFLIANHLYGPSYISVDSALFHWGMIPERVFEITSMTTKKSKKIVANNKCYSYTYLPIAYYPLGIQSLALTENQIVLIASPEKCLTDKVVTTSGINLRSKKQAMGYLVEDLRIEKDRLRELNLREMVKWIPDCPKKNSIQILIQAIAEL